MIYYHTNLPCSDVDGSSKVGSPCSKRKSSPRNVRVEKSGLYTVGIVPSGISVLISGGMPTSFIGSIISFLIVAVVIVSSGGRYWAWCDFFICLTRWSFLPNRCGQNWHKKSLKPWIKINFSIVTNRC